MPLRADWETVKEEIMKTALSAKFSQNSKLGALLISTDGREIRFFIFYIILFYCVSYFFILFCHFLGLDSDKLVHQRKILFGATAMETEKTKLAKLFRK